MRTVAAAALLALLAGTPARAEPEAAGPRSPGTVLTFYGLRQLEEDPQVPDDRKVQEWEAFVARATEHVAYARKASERWRNAARARVVDAARAGDRDDAVAPARKIELWREVARVLPKGREAKEARARVGHWEKQELRRLAEAAEEVERGGKPKTERIEAWAQVAAWGGRAPEARRAEKRIEALAAQLFAEAESVDRIDRVDVATKLAAWKDVLAGRPTARHRARAEARVAALEKGAPR
jgi:hypothetical protein